MKVHCYVCGAIIVGWFHNCAVTTMPMSAYGAPSGPQPQPAVLAAESGTPATPQIPKPTDGRTERPTRTVGE